MKNAKLLALSLLVASGFAFYSCSDDDDDGGLPPIGGFNNADEVGEADLVAYWGLNGDGEERETSTMPNDTEGLSWTDGIKGQAASLSGGFLSYSNTDLPSMTNFSVSCWFKVSNNQDGLNHPSVFFTMTRPGEWAGNINFMAETGWQPAASDSLTVKGLLVSNNDLGFQDVINAIKATPEQIAEGWAPHPNKVAGTGNWVHGVITWDNATRMFKLYVNGVKISNPVWELRGSDSSPAFMMNDGSFPVLGAFGTFAAGTSTDDWIKGLTGQLDEVRVWKRALTQAEIGSLYQLELVGR